MAGAVMPPVAHRLASMVVGEVTVLEFASEAPSGDVVDAGTFGRLPQADGPQAILARLKNAAGSQGDCLAAVDVGKYGAPTKSAG